MNKKQMLRSEVDLALTGWHRVQDVLAAAPFRVCDQDPRRGDVEIEWAAPTPARTESGRRVTVFDRKWLSAVEFRELFYREANAQVRGKHADLPVRKESA